MSELDSNKLVPVHVCWSDTEADVIMSFLAANEVKTITSSRMDHTVFPVIADGLGEIRILVAEEDAARAIELLRECQAGDMDGALEVGEPEE